MLAAIDLLEYRPGVKNYREHMQLLTTFCNLVARGYRGYYSSYVGQAYFERLGQKLDATATQHLDEMVTLGCRLSGRKELDWLDLGCGNGRHIAHLYRNYPNVKVRGLEFSNLGIELCMALVKSQKLPVGVVEPGDIRQLPYANESFDVLFSRFVLQAMPYFPGTGLGMEAAFEEMARVLRPGGIAILTVLHGHGREYLLPRQLLNEADVQSLATKSKLRVESLKVENEIAESGLCKMPLGQPNGMDLQVILQKAKI